MRCFVKEDDKVQVKIYVGETDNGNIEAGLSPSEISSKSPQEITFIFRRPRHQDTLAILSASRVNETGITDYVGLQAAVLRQLLIDWDIKDENGNKIEFSKAAIANLQPAIARAAASGFLDQCSI